MAQEIQQIEIPILYYKGYKAEINGGGQLGINAGTSGRISMNIPAGFNDTVLISFKEPWYWRCSEIVSFMAYMFLIWTIIFKWRESRGNYDRKN